MHISERSSQIKCLTANLCWWFMNDFWGKWDSNKTVKVLHSFVWKQAHRPRSGIMGSGWTILKSQYWTYSWRQIWIINAREVKIRKERCIPLTTLKKLAWCKGKTGRSDIWRMPQNWILTYSQNSTICGPLFEVNTLILYNSVLFF